ncbi:MAG: hypothetical protein VE96_C0024G0004 [candidate division Kazan bacterium GW2011_GWA1_44_22]|uniref:HTH cro/C1-type domain-containing protein n=1 Tax=candidate division Kazan bacterium GW2011_GWA1_44_22 TaxID=1620410 RepID=A0A0G1K6A8_UNCK3|nr:MAG: hypothetical protein VE96_C0024G0004 [candidate division Kazan bacterium GW2011_GWA1_44_22]
MSAQSNRGKMLFLLRSMKGESRKELAAILGITTDRVFKIEHGLSQPSKKLIEKMVQHFDSLDLAPAKVLTRILDPNIETSKKYREIYIDTQKMLITMARIFRTDLDQ